MHSKQVPTLLHLKVSANFCVIVPSTGFLISGARTSMFASANDFSIAAEESRKHAIYMDTNHISKQIIWSTVPNSVQFSSVYLVDKL